MAFKFKKLNIEDVYYIETEFFCDERGNFIEMFKSTDFKKIGIDKPFVQMNRSKNHKNVIRGMHYQRNPYSQDRLISVLSGEIFDVAVDIRKGSPTYRKWTAINLSAEKRNMLYVPQGFAHGFCALTEGAEICYLSTAIYAPEYKASIAWDDPDLAIDWPTKNPILIDKDKNLPMLKNTVNNFQYITCDKSGALSE